MLTLPFLPFHPGQVLLVAELEELQANPDAHARGTGEDGGQRSGGSICGHGLGSKARATRLLNAHPPINHPPINHPPN